MRKITFENEINGLSCEFSTDTPLMFLENFDGCSCGSDAIVYKPIEYDGQRFISSNLTARTVQFTANFGGKSGGRYSREAALSRWQDIQKVFVPGQIGKLTWTDGENSRFIKCRTNETPMPTEMMPYLFRVKFNLIADRPLWYESTANMVVLSGDSNNAVIENDCGIAVPFLLRVASSVDVFVMVSKTTGDGIGMINNTSEGFVIDTDKCTVTLDSGILANNLLSVTSEFFKLVPGTNELHFVKGCDIKLEWRRAYMGVF